MLKITGAESLVRTVSVEMHRKWLILAAVALAAVLGLLTFLTLRTPPSPFDMEVDISRSAGAEILLQASITNRISRTIKLNDRVQVIYVDEAGHDFATDYVRLAGSGVDIGGLAPQGFDSISLRAWDLDAQKKKRIGGVHLRFRYSYDSDPLRKFVGRICKRLSIRPPVGQGKWPPNACWLWLIQNGFLDGRFHMTYDRTWLAHTNQTQATIQTVGEGPLKPRETHPFREPGT